MEDFLKKLAIVIVCFIGFAVGFWIAIKLSRYCSRSVDLSDYLFSVEEVT